MTVELSTIKGQMKRLSKVIGSHQFPEQQAARARVVDQNRVQLSLGDKHIIILCKAHLRLKGYGIKQCNS